MLSRLGDEPVTDHVGGDWEEKCSQAHEPHEVAQRRQRIGAEDPEELPEQCSSMEER